MLFDKKGKKKLFYLCKQEQNRKQKKNKKDLMKIFISNAGPRVPREYYHLFCRTCQSGFE